MDPLLISIVALVVAVLAMAFAIVTVLRVNQANKSGQQSQQQQQALGNRISQQQAHCKKLEEELNELRSGLYGISDKMKKVQTEIQIQQRQAADARSTLEAKMQEIETADPGSRLYSKAAKLVASGATIEEIMQECDLPRAEAELLMNLHSKG